MISCVITTLKVNEYQRKSDFLRINFIISCQLIKKISIHKSRAYRVHNLDNVVFLSIHIMKVAGISPFNHLKCINWCFIVLIAARISSVTLLYKLQNATEKVVFRTNTGYQQPKLKERLVFWNEFDCDGKFSHVKLLIKEKYSHTIITERYRFCCFKSFVRHRSDRILDLVGPNKILSDQTFYKAYC